MSHAQRLLANLKSHPYTKGADEFGILGTVCKDAALDEGQDKNDIVAIATTDDIDLEDEVVMPSGLDKAYMVKNKQVFVDHEYGIDKAAGFIRSIGAYPERGEQRGWRVRIGLYDNPVAAAVKEIARKSGQIGVSIGFKPLKVSAPTEGERKRYGDRVQRVIREAEWFELSFTAIPCNVSCQGSIVDAEPIKAITEGVRSRTLSVEAGKVFSVNRPTRSLVVGRGVFLRT